MSPLKDYEHIPAVSLALSTINAPAITDYELHKLMFKLDLYSGADNLAKKYGDLVDVALSLHLLKPLDNTNAYLIFRHATSDPKEILCAIDPFSYISHLSAMEYHGLTDRFSKILYATRPSSPTWKEQAAERMKKDLGKQFDAYCAAKLPMLVRRKLDTIMKTPVQMKERSQLGAFRHVSGSALRVSTIGRVFLDMVREPKLCGGIQHVVDVYRKEAHRYLKFIVDEINLHGVPIDKVRAGYLLTEVCKLDDASIQMWANFAQRGGSRKLDPDSDYAHQHSEMWKLSINVPSLLKDIDIEND